MYILTLKFQNSKWIPEEEQEEEEEEEEENEEK